MNIQAIEALLRQQLADPAVEVEVSCRDRVLFVFLTGADQAQREDLAAAVYATVAGLFLGDRTELRVLDGCPQPQCQRWQRSFPLPVHRSAASDVPGIWPGRSTGPRRSGEKARRRSWIGLSAAVLLALMAGGVAAQWRLGAEADSSASGWEPMALVPLFTGDRSVALQPRPMGLVPEQLELRLALFGDVFWGRYIHDWSRQHPLQQAYPFSKLDDLGKFAGEYWIGNLECPVTQIETPSAQQEARLKFNCLPDYLPEAARWFDAFSLANNHTDNWNEYDGFTVTQGYLDDHGIRYFGHYANQPDEICKVLAMPAQHNTYRLPVALCGYHGLYRQITEAEIAVIADYAPHMPVIAMPHAGAEYVTTPDSIKVSAYRRMVDYGAAMVIGGHPHAVQTTEAYQGRLIVYSQGNFLFDQQRGILRTTHLGIRARLQVGDSAYIAAAVGLPEDCFNRSTLCPEIVNLPAPQYRVTYDPVYTANPERVPRLAQPAEVDYIKQVSRIEETLSQLRP